MRITIIGGGNMGGAMAKGMAAGKIVDAANIRVTAKSEQTCRKISGYDPRMQTGTDNRTAVEGADLIILAIKPWLLEDVVNEIKDKLDYSRQAIASVVAGVNFEKLHQMLDNGSGIRPVLFRIIPNTAISIGESVTFIAADGAGQPQIDTLKSIFDELGLTMIISEAMMPAATSLASCGIAFALRYINDSMQGGIESGFTPQDARQIVMQTVRGALEMLAHNETMPQTEIDKVTTPGGITLKGLAAMEKAGFTEAVKAGLTKSR